MRALSVVFLIFCFSASLALRPSSLAFAAVPSTINFQGRLSDSGDTPLSGSHSFNFALYDLSSGGTSLWTEAQTLLVSEGIYNCQLGSITPLNLAFDKPYYLEVSVDGNTLSPRQGLSANPYSLNSQRLEGLSATDFLKPDSLGNVGIGLAAPTAKLDVNGKIRGAATYAQDPSSYPPPSTTATASSWTDSLKATLNVQKDDLVMVILAVNLRNSNPGGITYMKSNLYSGSANSVLDPNWITVSGSNWVAGTSIGIYKATADTTLDFRGYWHVGSGTGYHVYGNLVAWVIGKG